MSMAECLEWCVGLGVPSVRVNRFMAYYHICLFDRYLIRQGLGLVGLVVAFWLL
jgi:hypothetical protein